MTSLNVRISEASHQALRQLAEGEGESMQSILAKALEEYRRKRFLEETNAAFEALRADRKAWAEEQTEREAWDNTLQDGLEES